MNFESGQIEASLLDRASPRATRFADLTVTIFTLTPLTEMRFAKLIGMEANVNQGRKEIQGGPT